MKVCNKRDFRLFCIIMRVIFRCYNYFGGRRYVQAGIGKDKRDSTLHLRIIWPVKLTTKVKQPSDVLAFFKQRLKLVQGYILGWNLILAYSNYVGLHQILGHWQALTKVSACYSILFSMPISIEKQFCRLID